MDTESSNLATRTNGIVQFILSSSPRLLAVEGRQALLKAGRATSLSQRMDKKYAKGDSKCYVGRAEHIEGRVRH
jgi:hypothetical protein